jgi:hypothetical protein
VILETFGVSRLQWDRIGSLPSDGGNLLRLAAEPGLIRSEHWEVQDQGFVTARNRYCADKSEVDERRFVARHVESVARRLATLGLEADADTRNRYRRFALAGGKLSLSVALPRPMSASALLQLHPIRGMVGHGGDTRSRRRHRHAALATHRDRALAECGIRCLDRHRVAAGARRRLRGRSISVRATHDRPCNRRSSAADHRDAG